jgi:hypothetical protein
MLCREKDPFFRNISPMAFGAGLMQLDSVFSGQSPAGNALIGGEGNPPAGPPRRRALGAQRFDSLWGTASTRGPFLLGRKEKSADQLLTKSD